MNNFNKKMEEIKNLSNNEQYSETKEFLEQICSFYIDSISKQDFFEIIYFAIDIFYKSYTGGENGYDYYEYYSDMTEKLYNIYEKRYGIEKILSNDDDTWLIISVAGVYGLTWKYTEKVNLMKKVVNSNATSNEHKKIAVEYLLDEEPETQMASTAEEKAVYIKLKERLDNL